MSTEDEIAKLTAKATAQGEAIGIGKMVKLIALDAHEGDDWDALARRIEHFAEARDEELKEAIKTGVYAP